MKLYGICARQYRLSPSQKADSFMHVFDGSARKFFFENTNEQMSYKGTLRLRSFVAEKEIDDISDGLTKIVEHINELVPQCPLDSRSDAHEIDYLRKAVTEFQN